MGRFAHIADVHLGFQKRAALKEVEQSVFCNFVERCISEQVDFVLLCGDFFHVNIPDMNTCKFAFSQLVLLRNAQIPVYAVYGSHDFSPNSPSIIDLLHVAGLIRKVVVQKEGEGISLGFVADPKTGAKIAGLPGLKAGRDVDFYRELHIGNDAGFKIFLFHGAISELVDDVHTDNMPLSYLPPGFDYYAGGHLHKYDHGKFEDYPHVVYPGTPFCGYHNDLEHNARGTRRGFVIVDFDSEVTRVDFVEIKSAEYEIVDVDCNKKSAISVHTELCKGIGRLSPQDKIIILKLAGELSEGKTADVDTGSIRESLMQAGALDVLVHKSQMTSKEYKMTTVAGDNRSEIAHNIFFENADQVRYGRRELEGEAGVSLAERLLDTVKSPKIDNEKDGDYRSRIVGSALHTMEIGDDS